MILERKDATTRQIEDESPIDLARTIGVDAIRAMRRMRGAAVDADYREATDEQMFGILADAEALGSTAVSRITDLVSGVDITLEDWSKLLRDQQEKYKGHRPVALSPVSTELVGNLLAANCRNLIEGRRDTLERQLLEVNGLKHLTASYFLNDGLGVLAPLSSDYLFVALYREYVKRNTSSGCFVVKPVITGVKREMLVMPTDTQGKPFFSDHEEVVGLIDMGDMGDTRRALAGIVEVHYPDKFRNRYKRTPF